MAKTEVSTLAVFRHPDRYPEQAQQMGIPSGRGLRSETAGLAEMGMPCGGNRKRDVVSDGKGGYRVILNVSQPGD